MPDLSRFKEAFVKMSYDIESAFNGLRDAGNGTATTLEDYALTLEMVLLTGKLPKKFSPNAKAIKVPPPRMKGLI